MRLEHSLPKKVRQYLEIALAALIAILFVLCVILAREAVELHRSYGSFPHRYSITAHAFSHPGTKADVAYIEPWMTFSYIDYLFGLSPDYLKTALAVKDTRYPYLTVSEYAREHSLSRTAALTQVREALLAQFASSTAP